jgi:undecaprenyl-diphosphatase
MIASVSFLIAFLLWTVAVATVDVQPIGPEDSRVGFSGLNQWLHQRTGVHMELYVLTDWLSLIPLCFVAGFGFLGLCQWISRRSFWKVDRSILVLGGLYLVTGAVFLFFEKCIINYRPVLMDGILEASYPSSTTMLMLCVMPTAAMQLRNRIRHKGLRRLAISAMTVFTLLMVIGRVLSGVHWFTDIVGGILLSCGLVALYAAVE